MTANGTGPNACPVCGCEPAMPFLDLRELPVHPNALWESRDAALAAPRADIRLTFCERCGMIWNAAFDRTKIAYTPQYENSLHFSPAFQRYVSELADRLIERYDLRQATVAEIGSGKGEFLALICARGDNRGIGFDPTYAGESDQAARGRIQFVRELYTEETAIDAADLVVCRHVLEHLDDPLALLTGVRRAIGDRDTVVYLEVPSGDHLLEEPAVWDVIYPHHSIFTAGSLQSLFERAGFDVLDLGFSFGDQYLWIEARAGRSAPAAARPRAGIQPLVESFAGAFAERRRFWEHRLSEMNGDGLAVWGAGAKGTTFLNLVEGAAGAAVVDINPRKHGKFVPGTGQRIAPPEDLAHHRPAQVLAMNAVYRNEIAERLRTIGVPAPVNAV